MEGGALRGLFTAGVMDVLMENGITFDGAIGVSAGAVFGCNYKSRQIGRVVRYNTTYCADKRYSGWGSWLRTGDFYNVQFDYEEIPKRLDVFDTKAYAENPMEFYVVVTDADTGEAVYQKVMRGDDADVEWMRASASMPMLSRIVRIDGKNYSDGGTADSIPLAYFQSIGYARNAVISTQPSDYVKGPNKMLPLFRLALWKYPGLVAALKVRHERYNAQMRYLAQAEQAGDTFVIRPPASLNIEPGERDREELLRVYRIGREEAEKRLPALLEFLKK